MNWDQIEGNWKQLKGNVKQQWGKLTNDPFDVISGELDFLDGRIQESYGVARDKKAKQLSHGQKLQRDYSECQNDDSRWIVL
jgi:uncharacterized protein YjbJ (UPF0337 family)